MRNYRGSDLGQDFKIFFRREKRRIAKVLDELGCTNLQMSMQFYYYYGFFTSPTGQVYYFNISDVRHGFNKGQMMYRTAKDYKDFTGGANQWVNEEELETMRLK